MNHLIWRFEKLVFVINVVFSVLIMILANAYNGLLSLLMLFVLLAGSYIASRRNSLILNLINIYVWYVGPFSITIASLLPSIIGPVVTHSITAYIDNADLVSSYCNKLLVFYVVFLLSSFVNESLRRNRTVRLKTRAVINSQAILPLSVVFAGIEYYTRITYSINIPGRLPTIPFAGIILYFFQGFNMFFLFLSLHKNIAQKDEVKFKYFLNVIIIAIITQVPNVLIGKRGGFLNVILMIILYSCLYKFDITSVSVASKRRIFRIGIIAVVVLLVGVGTTNMFRVGQFETIGFLINRFTGLLDGMIALSGIGNKGVPYSLIDYFKTIIFESELTTNKYYTINILGYSASAVHANAIPIFIGEWFYGGIIGIVTITCIESFALSRFENVIRNNSYVSIDNITPIINSAAVFCSLYAILLLVTFHFIDGNITSWKPFFPILICYLLAQITKDSSNYSTR